MRLTPAAPPDHAARLRTPPAGGRPPRHWGLLAALAVLALAAGLLALSCGSQGCAPGVLVHLAQPLADPAAVAGEGAASGDAALARELLWRLRLPRALAAFTVGGLLALAGALLQVLLRNPLAEPYVLGVSGGASFAALLGLWAGWAGVSLYGAAWAGAAVAMALLFGLGHRGLRSLDLRAGGEAPVHLLLTGVMLSAGWTALISLVLTLAPEAKLRGMLFWLIGEITGVEPWPPAAVALAVLLGLALSQARALNVLLAGDARAQSLGVPVARLRLAVCAIAAAATAVAVTTAGALGFVGLLVPHLVRRFTGNDQRWLLPAAVLAGGATVVLADTLARTVVAPTQLPVGAIMSLVGVPVFLWILSRGAGTARAA
jgi:iron complex transport system permease protein